MTQKSFTVYVVDDDESVRKALKRLFNSLGYDVTIFDSAERLLEFVGQDASGCFVLDITLPGMDGLALQERLRAQHGQHAVIFITAHDNPQWREHAIAGGAVAYLRKPFDQDLLLQAIQKCRQVIAPPT